MNLPDVKALVEAGRRAARKMKHEYDLQHSDARPDECWREQQHLVQCLADFDVIYPPKDSGTATRP